MRVLVLVPLLLVHTACWSARAFMPREHVDGSGPQGQPAALYVIDDLATQRPVAELRVWSGGAAAMFTDDDKEIVELHLGFELENNGSTPLQLDLGSIVCEGLRLDDQEQQALNPTHLDGDGIAPPSATVRVDAIFEPGTTVPADIGSFAVRFQVLAGEHAVLTQVTPFVPWRRPHDDWGPPWGFGFGFGFGFHHHHHR
ncbi:MAG: hypothetical protein WBO45_21345 [Planctomycetota bacterium]